MKNLYSLTLSFAFIFIFMFTVQFESQSKDRLFFQENFSNIADNGLPVGWEAWKPRNMEMLFEPGNAAMFPGKTVYRMSGNGKYHTKGSLKRKIGGFEVGKYYKFIVHYTVVGIHQSSQTKVFPVIKWGTGKHFDHIVPVENNGGWNRAELIHQVTEGSQGEITIELFAGWVPDGSVYWSEVKIFELEEFNPEKKIIRVTLIDKAPPEGCSLKENCAFYISQIDLACKEPTPDVICLTEMFNIFKVKPVDEWANAVTMGSGYMQKIKEAAQRNKVNLVGSILENDNGVLFNTGFLINRQGELVDKYNKAQLAMTEILYDDISRGDKVKTMEADFGKIGIAICWDYQFPEFTRTLALKGAELIFVPIGGDERLSEDGIITSMEHVGKTISLENRVPVVFARRSGTTNNPSRIIDSNGKVVAKSTEGQDFISSSLDIKYKHYMWNKSGFTKAYFISRRPELYKEISNDSNLLYRK